MAKKKTGSKLFEYVNAMSLTKSLSPLEDEDFEKHYVPFIVNRAFSYHADSVLAANLLNERSTTSKYLQFRFLSATLRSRKRYSPWLKYSVSDDVKTVSAYYGCSVRHAKRIVDLHSSDQLLHMRTRLKKGGLAPDETGSAHGSDD